MTPGILNVTQSIADNAALETYGIYILDYLPADGGMARNAPRPKRSHRAALLAVASSVRGLSAHSHTISTRQPNVRSSAI